MNPSAVVRSKQEKEVNTYYFSYKTIEGTLILINGSVENISFSIDCIEKVGQREAVLRTLDDISLGEAKNLYLVLRSLLKITGDLEELDKCIL